MDGWHWLIGGITVLVLVVGLWGLHRLCLWLEDRGWLYYLRKKPSSSAGSSFVVLQQFIEPGVQHLIQVEQERRSVVDREWLLANLLACFDAETLNPEEIRHYLTLARQTGLDWQELYQEAVRVQEAVRPALAARLPRPESVAPAE
jgi:hypothetical protein